MKCASVFIGPLEKMLNTEHVRQMESDGSTVKERSTLEILKDITLMENNSFHSLNFSNTCSIPSIHKTLTGPFYNCDAEDHIAQKFHLPHI